MRMRTIIANRPAEMSQVSRSASTGVNSLAFGLSLAGLVIQGASALWMSMMFLFFYNPSYGFYGRGITGGGMMNGYYRGMMGSYYSPGMIFGWMGGTLLVVSALVIALGAIGVLQLRSSDTNKVTTGSILVLIAAVIAYPTMWGFGIGSLLMGVGAILGLTSSRNW